jgi:hypothetical protein
MNGRRIDQGRSIVADGRRSGRGQTTLDFSVGISVFLLVVAFAFLFAPGFLQPFTQAPAEETVVANRVADKLTSDLWGSPNTTYVVDDDCAVPFFDSGAASPDGCKYTGTTVNERVNLSDRHSVNVTVWGNLSSTTGRRVLCYDQDDEVLSERSCAAGAQRLAIGANPNDQQTVVNARRVVSLAGEDVTLEVEVW